MTPKSCKKSRKTVISWTMSRFEGPGGSREPLRKFPEGEDLACRCSSSQIEVQVEKGHAAGS